ncbi:MAG: helix-turn-helix transcriptional regulator [Actinomycetia bacterium]|nr:helix-turn-helix transcriptional regulator [Actinomycetes bacterium]
MAESEFRRDLNEDMKDPEFRAAWEEADTEYKLQWAIIKAREERNMTQQQLAEATGMNQRVISRIESGNCNTTFKTLQRLAKGLDKKLVIRFEERVSS